MIVTISSAALWFAVAAKAVEVSLECHDLLPRHGACQPLHTKSPTATTPAIAQEFASRGSPRSSVAQITVLAVQRRPTRHLLPQMSVLAHMQYRRAEV